MVLLYKKGDPHEAVSYRSISLMYSTMKVYERILTNRMNKQIGSHAEHSLSKLQGACKVKLGALDTVEDILATLEHLNPQAKALICQIDYSKAFDRVIQIILWEKLIKKGITGKILTGSHQVYLQGRKNQNPHRSQTVKPLRTGSRS